MIKTLLKCGMTIIVFLSASISYSDQVYLTLIKEVMLASAPIDIVLNEGYAYVTTGGTLYSFSTADPYKIEQFNYDELSGTSSISFTGRIAYALGNNSEINLFDFTKNTPVKKSSIKTNGKISKIVIDNGYLYVLNQDAGLQVYDVNVGDFPIYRNTQILPAEVNGIFIKERIAYVTGLNAHLSIIDAADISKLTILGTYTNGVKFYEPYVDGNYIYIPQGNTGVQVLNISKLPFPEWVANIPARKSAKQVAASNFYVWVVDDKSIEGYFNKESNAFFYAGSYKNNAAITRIALIEGKYIYMATADKKLKILKIEYKY